MKVVINTCYCGFGLSEQALVRYTELSGINVESYNGQQIHRTDAALIQTIEELGIEKSSGVYAELKIVDIPDDVEWEIDEYDGKEWVAEVHRTWS
jgi:hypothetical protein